MKYVTIPKTDLQVSQICLGSVELGLSLAKDQSFALLDAFVAGGGNFIDTAHVYSNWIPNTKSSSEKMIGQWLSERGLHKQIIVGTKGAHPELATMHVSRLSRADIEQDINESLEYLQAESIDLYWLHRDDDQIPVGNIIDALNEQVSAGTIRYFGCSNWKISRIQEALDYAVSKGIQSFVANQPLWSLATANMDAIADKTLVGMDDAGKAFHKRTGMSVIPYTSQAKGFFTKLEASGIDGIRASDKGIYLSESNMQRLPRVQELAKKYDGTVNDIALAYLMSQPFTTIPVVGCRTHEQLTASLNAVNVTLTSDEIAYLDNA